MVNEESAENNRRETRFGRLWLYVGIVIVLWASTFFLFLVKSDNGTARGQFGDMFGAANALFSGLAFAGLIFTIQLQKEELALQRQELADTREELKGQKEQLALQNETMRKQQFESTFFQLLSLYLRMTNDYAGVLEDRHSELDTLYGRFKRERGDQGDGAHLVAAENEFYKSYRKELRLYLDSLFHVVEFLDQETHFKTEFYVDLVRAYISRKMQKIVFYYVVTSEDEKRRRKLVEKFELLADFNFDMLIIQEHRNLIAASAFGLL